MLDNNSSPNLTEMVFKSLKRICRDQSINEELDKLFVKAQKVKNTDNIFHINHLWEEISKIVDIPELSIRLGESLADLFRSHLIYLILMNSDSFGSAFEKFIRYHTLLAFLAIPEVKMSDNNIIVSINMLDNSIEKELGTIIVVFFIQVLRNLSEGRIRISGIRLKQDKSDCADRDNYFFGHPVCYSNEVNEFEFEESVFSHRIFMADGGLQRSLEDYLNMVIDRKKRGHEWSFNCKKFIKDSILSGDIPSISDLAAKHNMSVRTFQNKLKNEGSTFREINQKVKIEIAGHSLLEEKLNLIDIAFLLGFSDQSGFNHAFKRWTDLTPGEYKDQHQ